MRKEKFDSSFFFKGTYVCMYIHDTCVKKFVGFVKQFAKIYIEQNVDEYRKENQQKQKLNQANWFSQLFV